MDCGGLSTIFGFFMQKGGEDKKKKKKDSDEIYIRVTREDIEEDDEHCVSIILSLLVNTMPDEGSTDVGHERILFKFIENNYEKLHRLIELH